MIAPLINYSSAYSAPGKLIISGDHSVVYGLPGLSCAITRRAKVSSSIITREMPSFCPDCFIVQFPDLRVYKRFAWILVDQPISEEQAIASPISIYFEVSSPPEAPYIASDVRPNQVMLTLIAKMLCDMFPDTLLRSIIRQELSSSLLLTINIESAVPIGMGVGSSAAIAVALSASLIDIFLYIRSLHFLPSLYSSPEEHHKAIDSYALFCEQIMHGTPSGIDNRTCLEGGILEYIRPFHKKLDFPLPFKMLLVYSGISKDTKQSLIHVKNLKERDEIWFKRIIDRMGKITENIISHVIEGRKCDRGFCELIEENQEMLRKLEVSHETIEEIVDICKSEGFCSKVTGGGKGGCVCVFIDNEEKVGELIAKLQIKNYKKIFRFDLDMEGLRKEEI